MKNPRSWLRTIILVACILSVTACTVTLSGCSSPSSPNSYTLIWHPEVSGFPNVNLTLIPVIPPKALSLKPSDYVQVNGTVGNFTFSTNDAAYQCLETVAATTLPIILAPESQAISGFAAINDFLIVYQACGKFVQTSPANLASLGGIAEKNLIFFQITGQKMVSQAANGQQLTPSGPVGVPTPTPTVAPPPPTPTVAPPPLTPTVQILSPTAGASYNLIANTCAAAPCPETFSLVLMSQASAGVISYAWSDTLGLVKDSNANDTLTLAPTVSQVPCNTPVNDTISLTVTDSSGQTATAEVPITIERQCIQ